MFVSKTRSSWQGQESRKLFNFKVLYLFAGLMCLIFVPTPPCHFKESRNLLVCLQFEISSLLLFSVDISGLQIIKYFSHKHGLHFLLTLEYDRVCFNFHHLMLYKIFLSFRPQIYLLNSVVCLYLSFLNEHTWFLSLKLKVVSQRPMFVYLVVDVVTSA